MFYAVIIAVVLSGSVTMIYRPVESLTECRKIVEIVRDNPQPGVIDVQCIGVIFDKWEDKE